MTTPIPVSSLLLTRTFAIREMHGLFCDGVLIRFDGTKGLSY